MVNSSLCFSSNIRSECSSWKMVLFEVKEVGLWRVGVIIDGDAGVIY